MIWGVKYTSNDFSRLLASDGTHYQISCTDTPEQNVVAEKKYWHLVEQPVHFYCLLVFLVSFEGKQSLPLLT